jgi:DNA-binding response OmpR family regulator
MRILIIEQDAPLAEFIGLQLRDSRSMVDIALDAPEALRLLGSETYQLAILDLGLPGEQGPAEEGRRLLRQIRAAKPNLLILVLTGAIGIAERVALFDLGADEYLVKPFSYAELCARVRALLRRFNGPVMLTLKVHDLELDRVGRTVRRGGSAIDLTQKEFALLEFLMQRPLQPITRTVITEQAWKLEGGSTTNAVDVYINYLRKKIDLGFDRPLIQTVRGVGYQIGCE